MNIIINPGTETQTKHSEENAVEIAKTISKDLKLPTDSWKRTPEKDDSGRGWYSFTFKNKHNQTIEVDIPGIDHDTVVKGEPWVSPRLYVDGNSWLYGYALGFIERRESN